MEPRAKVGAQEQDAVIDRIQHRVELAEHPVLVPIGARQFLLAALQVADVGEHGDSPAVPGLALVDLDPAAVGLALQDRCARMAMARVVRTLGQRDAVKVSRCCSFHACS